jgi:ATP-dependent Clp protease protease subunit
MVKKHKKTNEAIQDNWLFYGVDPESRTVMIDEEINEHTIGLALRGIRSLVMNDSESKITLILSTYGGDLYSAYGLYDYLRTLSCPIQTIGIGQVMSAGTLLFLAGDERIALPHTTFMVHSASMELDESKTYAVATDSIEIQRIWGELCETYAYRTSHKDAAWWKRWAKYEDRYLTAAEALDMGLATEIKR